MALYYLADLHLGHQKMALLRGFSSSEEHDRTILDNIGARVGPNDTLYLLGDVFAYDYDPDLLTGLHRAARHIVLIRGNHERHWIPKADLPLLFRTFSAIRDSDVITDEGRTVFLSHTPTPSLQGEGDAFYLYGHLHDRPPRREDWKAFCGRPHALNVSAEIGAYTSGRWGKPAGLDEWLFFNEVWRSRER